MLAAVNTSALVLIGLGVILFLVSIWALALRQRARQERPEVPYAMRPGPSDTGLETPLLHRLQGWAVLLFGFFVLWFPLAWLLEPSRNQAQAEEFRDIAIARGELAVLPFTEENQLGVGCTRCHGNELQGGVITLGEGYAYPKNLQTICAGNNDPEHAAITSVGDIKQVIMEGRPDAGMPSWSIRFEGALSDQQINDIVLYLVVMSSEFVSEDENVCTNPDAMEAAVERADPATIALP
jgi:mono/diheme cytochrome c family protein